MADRAALVTGGSSGIGLAIARALGEDGYGVTIAARRPEKLEAAAEELRSAGLDLLAVPAQMTEEEEVVRVVSEHRDRWGRLDALVNNAGVGIGGAIEEYPTKRIDMQLDLNLRAVIVATREGLPMLREAGAAHGKALIVNTASIAGKSGQGCFSVYSATKASFCSRVIAKGLSSFREGCAAGKQKTFAVLTTQRFRTATRSRAWGARSFASAGD